MSLIKQLNESVNTQTALEETWDASVTALMEATDMTATQINEAATQWIRKLGYALERGRLDPRKQAAFASILGALLAIADGKGEIADALDEKGDMGGLLAKVSGEDKALSDGALKRLVQIGRDPSVRGYVKRAQEIFANPAEAGNALKKAQISIDRVMTRKVQQEQGAGNGQALKTPLSQPKATTPGLQV